MKLYNTSPQCNVKQQTKPVWHFFGVFFLFLKMAFGPTQKLCYLFFKQIEAFALIILKFFLTPNKVKQKYEHVYPMCYCFGLFVEQPPRVDWDESTF